MAAPAGGARERKLLEVCRDDSVPTKDMLSIFALNPTEWRSSDGKGLYPLQVLCLNSTVTPEVLGAFLDRFPEAAKQPDRQGLFPIHRLCQNQAVTPDLLAVFLKRCPYAGSQADASGYHALHALCENPAIVPELLEPLLAACPEAAKQANESCSYPLQTLCMNPAVTQQLVGLFLKYCPEAAEQSDDTDRYPLHCLCSNPAVTKPSLRLLLQRFPKAVKEPDYPVLRLCRNPACDSELLGILQSYYSEHKLEEDQAFLDELKAQLLQEGDAALHIMNFVRCDRKLEIEGPARHRTALRLDGYTYSSGVRTALRSSAVRDSTTVDRGFADELLPQARQLQDELFLQPVGRTAAQISCFRLRGLCSRDLVDALSRSPEMSALSTDAAEAIVTHAWGRFFWWYVVGMLFNMMVLALVVDATISMRKAIPMRPGEMPIIAVHIALVVLFQAVNLVDCVVQSVRKRDQHPVAVAVATGLARYVNENKWGAFSAVLEVLAFEVMVTTPDLMQIPLAERWFLAGWCGLRWLQIIWGMRVFDLFGPRMLPIVNSIRDTVAFSIILLFTVMSSTHAFYVIGTRKDPVGHELHGAFAIAVRLGIMGDFDLYEIEDNDPYWEAHGNKLEEVDKPASQYYELAHVWFYISSVFLCLLMTNLLTGILGNNYDRFTELSRPLFVRERAHTITRMSACFVGKMRPWVWPQEWESQDLWTAQRAMPDADQDRSSRAAFRAAIVKSSRKPLEMRIDHFEDALGEKVKGLDQQLAGLEAKLDRMADSAPAPGEAESSRHKSI